MTPTPRILVGPDRGIHDAHVMDVIAGHVHRPLDAWQQHAAQRAGLRIDARWAAHRVGILTPRQNGKTHLAEVRELTGLFAYGENIIHSTPSGTMSSHAFRRMLNLIESSPDLERRLGKVHRSRGSEEIVTRNGNRILYGMSRPIHADLLVIDDAHVTPEVRETSLYPAIVGSLNPQIWYLGGAVRKAPARRSSLADPNRLYRLFTRVRRSALEGTDPGLCWIEYSAPDDRDERGQLLVDTSDPAVWRAANPAIDRMNVAHISSLRRELTPETFETEILGIGDWPELDQVA